MTSFYDVIGYGGNRNRPLNEKPVPGLKSLAIITTGSFSRAFTAAQRGVITMFNEYDPSDLVKELDETKIPGLIPRAIPIPPPSLEEWRQLPFFTQLKIAGWVAVSVLYSRYARPDNRGHS